MSTLKAELLAKSYKGRQVVKNVGLEVEAGSIVGLLGPNGAGKTTTFYMIVGLVPSDKGKISIDDNDITLLPMHNRARLGIGYLPQESSIFRKLTVYQNLMAILETRKDLNKAGREETLNSLLDEFSIQHIRDSQGMALSGGERRRVEIARALASRPSFMLLDEPFTGIDPLAISDISDLVRYLKERGIGVLITDHQVRETLQIVDRASIIYDGRVLFEGTPEDILKNEEVRRVYLGERFAA